jgi:threonine dehydratase
LLGRRAITEFNYRYADAAAARIFVGVQLSEGEAEKRQIIAMLAEHGYPVLDLSDNELAKLHIRYMVGGRAPGLGDEMLFRFQFPERPGALLKFLNSLSADWNISLFHYRNHGADYGRVLAGIQIPPAGRGELARRLDALGYPYWHESENPAYLSFLAETPAGP